MSSGRKLPASVTAAAAAGDGRYSNLDEKIAKRRRMKHRADDDDDGDDDAMDVDEEDISSDDGRQLKQGVLTLTLLFTFYFILFY